MAKILCALALLPLCASFAPSPLAGVRWNQARASVARPAPGLRRGGGVCTGLRMSDLGDMTVEMMGRLSKKGLDEMGPKELERLRTLCGVVAAKIEAMAPADAGPAAFPKPTPATDPIPKPFVIGSPTAPTEKESDSYFGLDEGPVSETGEVIAPVKKGAPPVKDFGTTTGTARYSKYIAEERDTTIKKGDQPTKEAIVDKDSWEKEYEAVFGRKSNDIPVSDIDTLTAPKKAQELDPNDPYSVVRKVQASADSYATSAEYYAALNEAIGNWKQSRVKKGHKIGAESSNSYIEQLAHHHPDAGNKQVWGEKKKFTLDCMLNPAEAEDENGNMVSLLQFTEIDEHGAAGYAGIVVGEALVAMNGTPIGGFDDLKKELKKIHDAKAIRATCMIAGPSGNREVEILGATED